MFKLLERYANFIVENKTPVFVISIIFIASMGIIALDIESSPTDHEDAVPDHVEAINANDFIADEFGTSGSSVNIVVRLDYDQKGGIRDVRDPELLSYLRTLGQEIESLENVDSVDSVTDTVYEEEDRIPGSRMEVVRFLEEKEVSKQPEPFNPTEALKESQEGLEEVEEGMSDLEKGVSDSISGLEEHGDGLEEIRRNVESLETTVSDVDVDGDVSELQSGIEEVENGLKELQTNLYGISGGLEDTSTNITGISENYGAWIGEISDISTEEHVINELNDLEGNLSEDLTEASAELTTMSYNLEQSADGIDKMLHALSEIDQGIEELGEALEDINDLLNEIEVALNGISQVLKRSETATEEITNGLKEVETGITTLRNSISEINVGLGDIIGYQEIYRSGGMFEPIGYGGINMENMFSDDYSVTVLRISVNEMTRDEQFELVEDLQNIFDIVDNPSGVETLGSGDAFMVDELQDETDETLARTTMLSAFILIVLLTTFFLSFKYGITVFLTILFGEIVTLGTLSMLGMPIGSEMSGALTMIMAIGDDFGIQITNRFKQELRDRKRDNAMREALSNVIFPMSITTVSLLIGFQAFRFGQLDFLIDLGTMMSIGVFSCFVASITVIPTILLFTNKEGDD